MFVVRGVAEDGSSGDDVVVVHGHVDQVHLDARGHVGHGHHLVVHRKREREREVGG